MEFSKHYFEYDNSKYFRDNANNILLCSFGEKKDPIGPAAHLDPRGFLYFWLVCQPTQRQNRAGRWAHGLVVTYRPSQKVRRRSLKPAASSQNAACPVFAR